MQDVFEEALEGDTGLDKKIVKLGELDESPDFISQYWFLSVLGCIWAGKKC